MATSSFETALTNSATQTLRVSIVIPCLNKAENIEACVSRARVLVQSGLPGEVIVVDNGSEDGSGGLARAAGAIVIEEPRRGYGSAYLAGFAAARGDYVVMIDADLTYDFDEIPRFLDVLDDGAHMVIGDRMENIQPGAMSITSRIGNPLLTGFLNVLHPMPVRDAHCGLRAIRRDALQKLDLHSTGMEFASEMVIRAGKVDLDVRELPIALHQRGASRSCRRSATAGAITRLILAHNPNCALHRPRAPDAAARSGGVERPCSPKLSLFGRTWQLHTLIGGAAL